MRFTLVAVAAAAITFTGCGDSDDSTTTAPTTAAPTTTTVAPGSTTTSVTTTGSATTSSDKTSATTTGSSTTNTGTSTKFMSTTAAPTTDTYCSSGDSFCKSQTVNGGDFSGSHCKYYMEASVCQAPPGSTDEEQRHIPCSCDGFVTVTTKTPVTSVAPTEVPTEKPTEVPTEKPTEVPTEVPTEKPTEAPTEEPTEAPTEVPTEAPVPTPSGKYCGAIKVFGMPYEGSVTVTGNKLALEVGTLVNLKDVGYTIGENGVVNIDFNSPSMVELLGSFGLTPEDAAKAIQAKYVAADDSISLTLPVVGDFSVTKAACKSH